MADKQSPNYIQLAAGVTGQNIDHKVIAELAAQIVAADTKQNLHAVLQESTASQKEQIGKLSAVERAKFLYLMNQPGDETGPNGADVNRRISANLAENNRDTAFENIVKQQKDIVLAENAPKAVAKPETVGQYIDQKYPNTVDNWAATEVVAYASFRVKPNQLPVVADKAVQAMREAVAASPEGSNLRKLTTTVRDSQDFWLKEGAQDIQDTLQDISVRVTNDVLHPTKQKDAPPAVENVKGQISQLDLQNLQYNPNQNNIVNAQSGSKTGGKIELS